MAKKMLLGLLIIAVITGGVILVKNKQKDRPADNAGGFIISGNSIFVADQTPAQNVRVAIVRLEKPGFVVIHEDRDGSPGTILGSSELIATGETRDILISLLSRPTRDGEFLYAMLHTDNGDGVFDAAQDTPVIDPVGNEPVMTIFSIGEYNAAPGATNL